MKLRTRSTLLCFVRDYAIRGVRWSRPLLDHEQHPSLPASDDLLALLNPSLMKKSFYLSAHPPDNVIFGASQIWIRLPPSGDGASGAQYLLQGIHIENHLPVLEERLLIALYAPLFSKERGLVKLRHRGADRPRQPDRPVQVPGQPVPGPKERREALLLDLARRFVDGCRVRGGRVDGVGL